MISSLRKGIVAFAMFALLSTIPAVAWADGTINAEPAANGAPQASQVATWDCSDGGIVPESVYGRVDKPTVTFFTEGTFYQDTARNMLDYRLFGGFCGRDSGIGPAQRAKTTIWN